MSIMSIEWKSVSEREKPHTAADVRLVRDRAKEKSCQRRTTVSTSLSPVVNYGTADRSVATCRRR